MSSAQLRFNFKTGIFPMLFFERISDTNDEETDLAMKESGGGATKPMPAAKGY